MAEMTWQEALNRLQAGNARYQKDQLEGRLRDHARRQATTGGQQPYAIILTCADSRVVPEHLFDTGLGEIFVVRVAGNVPNPSSIASIEYGIAHLGTKLVVVMGHESCGAVGAALEGGDNGPNLNHLLAFIQPAIDLAATKSVNTVVKNNTRLTAQALTGNSKIIADAVRGAGVAVISAYYNLGSGAVDFDDAGSTA
jgi:carbonic anhydrase